MQMVITSTSLAAPQKLHTQAHEWRIAQITVEDYNLRREAEYVRLKKQPGTEGS